MYVNLFAAKQTPSINLSSQIDGSGSIDDVYAIARESMKTILQNLK